MATPETEAASGSWSAKSKAEIQAGFPAAEYSRRLTRAQAVLAKHQLDALVLFGSEGYPHGVRYFFGHWPSFEPALAFIPAQGSPLLVTGPETERFARERAPHGTVATAQELFFWAAPDYVDVSAPSLAEILQGSFGRSGLRAVGLTPRHAFPKAVSDALVEGLAGAALVDGDVAFVELRSVKSPDEVARLRAASLLAESVFERFLGWVRPGITELDVMDFINAEISAGGSEAPGYFGWCASGPNTINPIFRSTDRRLQKGDLVQVNIGPRIGGYSGSVGRAVGLGSLDGDARGLVTDALELASRTVEEVAAGRAASDVAVRVAAGMRARGYPGLYGPAHATGMEECELPWIQESSRFDLVPGMTFNVDLWLDRGDLGVRVEDGIVVTDDGCEILSPRFHEVYVA